MLVLAHRGANRLAPENTVAAMARAVELGADGVELDVHRSADGQLVVRHDAETPIGALGDLTLAEIRGALGDVPTLAEVLDVCRGRLVNVEVKDPDPRAADALVELLGRRSGADDVLVSSFDLPTVDRVRELGAAGAVGLPRRSGSTSSKRWRRRRLTVTTPCTPTSGPCSRPTSRA